jgi:hypothetical protein
MILTVSTKEAFLLDIRRIISLRMLQNYEESLRFMVVKDQF